MQQTPASHCTHCIVGRGQAHPGSVLKGSCWLLEEADGSPDWLEGLWGTEKEGRLRGVGGLATAGRKMKAKGRYPSVEEEKGLLAGLAVLCRWPRVVVCWAWGVAGDREEDGGKAGRVWTRSLRSLGPGRVLRGDVNWSDQ